MTLKNKFRTYSSNRFYNFDHFSKKWGVYVFVNIKPLSPSTILPTWLESTPYCNLSNLQNVIHYTLANCHAGLENSNYCEHKYFDLGYHGFFHTCDTSTSSQTIKASFPPSSRVTGINVSAAFLIICNTKHKWWRWKESCIQ